MNITSWYVAANDADTAQRLAWHARIHGDRFDAIGHRAEGYVATHPDDIPRAARARFTHAFTVTIDARGLPVRTRVEHTGAAPQRADTRLDTPSPAPVFAKAERANPRTVTIDDTTIEPDAPVLVADLAECLPVGRCDPREDIG